jgi:cell shape-determining protein MreD
MSVLVRTALALTLALVGAVLAVTLRARGWPVVPDLALIPVVAVALSRGWVAGALTGLAAGWMVDLVPPGGEPLGLTAVLYAVAGSLAGRGSRVGPVPGRWVAIVLLAAAAVPAVGGLLRAAWLGRPVEAAPSLLAVAATVVVGLLVVPPFVRLDRSEGWTG